MPIVYTAVQRFDPACGENWTKFIDWCCLKQLREVISLDGILCPSVIVIDELTAEDWQHVINENFKCHLFHDLEYLLPAISEVNSTSTSRMQILEWSNTRAITPLHASPW